MTDDEHAVEQETAVDPVWVASPPLRLNPRAYRSTKVLHYADDKDEILRNRELDRQEILPLLSRMEKAVENATGFSLDEDETKLLIRYTTALRNTVRIRNNLIRTAAKARTASIRAWGDAL